MRRGRIRLVQGAVPRPSVTSSDEGPRPEVTPKTAELEIEEPFGLERPGSGHWSPTRRSWMGIVNGLIMLTMLLMVFLARGEWSLPLFGQTSRDTESPANRPSA